MRAAAGIVRLMTAIVLVIGVEAEAQSGGRAAGDGGTAMNYEEIIGRYYGAFWDADKEALREVTTPGLKHVSEFATHTERDRMIETIWDHVGQSWAENLRIFGEYPAYMVRFRVVGGDRPARNMAEFIRFEGDRIAEVEVFMGRELE